MELTQAKCPNCNANLKVDLTQKTILCEYCSSQFITQNIIQQSQPQVREIEKQVIVNNYVNTNHTPKVKTPKRPKINKLLALIGLFYYIVPGIIYIVYKKHQQKQWDDKYT